MTNNIPGISFITIYSQRIQRHMRTNRITTDKIHSVSYEIIVVDNASHENEAAKNTSTVSHRCRYPQQ